MRFNPLTLTLRFHKFHVHPFIYLLNNKFSIIITSILNNDCYIIYLSSFNLICEFKFKNILISLLCYICPN
jgi:hypothetical protein